MPEVKPFKTDCRSCGAPMWMCPITKKGGGLGWAPMNVDEEDPNTPPVPMRTNGGRAVARKSNPIEEEEVYDPSKDVEALVLAETTLAQVEDDKREAMKKYRERITALKQGITRAVRRLNGEDDQMQMPV